MSKRATEKQWAARVAGWMASGLSSERYAAEHGFCGSNLRRWKRRLEVASGGEAAGRVEAAPVHLVRVETRANEETQELSLPQAGADAPDLVLELGPARVFVPSGFEPATLRVVLQSLMVATTEGAQ